MDDIAQVYGRRVSRLPNGTEVYGTEELLTTASYSIHNSGQYWPTCAGCKVPISRGIDLLLGERYMLRVRFVNTGGPDQIEVAMKIALPGHFEQTAAPRPTAQPIFVNTSRPSVSPTTPPATWAPSRTNAPTATATSAPSRVPTLRPVSAPKAPTRSPSAHPTVTPTRAPSVTNTRAPTRTPTTRPTAGPTVAPTHAPYQYNASLLPAEIQFQKRSLSNTFLRHPSLKDTQIVALKIPFFYEIQVMIRS